MNKRSPQRVILKESDVQQGVLCTKFMGDVKYTYMYKEKNSPSLHRDATMGICEQISHKLLKPKCRKWSPHKGFKGPR